MSDDAIQQNQNDLPSHWQVRTNTSSEEHHDDSPLFPPLKEKVLIENETPVLIEEPNEVLLSNKNESLLDSGKIEVMINSDKEISQEEKQNILESIENTNDNLHDVREDVIAEKEVEIDSDSQVFDNESNNDEISIEVEEAVETKPKKVIPVPHIRIDQAIDSKHPLSLPPYVIPFSTPAPSVHTKIAAIYTQPGATASAWLPWMRTSMWSKKMVKKATKYPEVDIKHENLPSVIPNSKPNVVYSPVYISQELQNNHIEIKKADIFEKPAEVSRIEFDYNNSRGINKEVVINSISSEEGLKSNNVTSQSIVSPRIDDSFDSALFGKDVASDNPINTIKNNVVGPDQKGSVKVNDSWDAAMFS